MEVVLGHTDKAFLEREMAGQSQQAVSQAPPGREWIASVVQLEQDQSALSHVDLHPLERWF